MAQETILHASCVAVDGRGVLIRGASGSGKSRLSIELMAWGARLVSDDRVRITRRGDMLHAEAPAPISGLIEARGMGLLRAPACSADIACIVDLDRPETERLPPWHKETLLGVVLPLLHNPGIPHFAASLLLYLREGRYE
ncbi:Hpr(Ser) kinase/phosphatase [Poseidonocella pacifica]|uniref:Hpr(Ser) kinase/phosphatase n=1 Tax=Poseidonocella pacifica TaxID=871651 RepID=A0A1I0YIX7_9RHOB|nr:HPr kinase/phosphatase C-terminal domain-containing protein [Poseidonocella pacifica]SFB13122.1 Hpr(Ser) kinase/phosphatase [Poseidonocella pacifica]